MNKIAISVLTRGYEDVQLYQSLIDRNNLIFEHIISKSKFEFDNVIFHEGNISEEHIRYISEKSMCPLIFKDIRFCGDKTAFDNSRDVVNMDLCPPTELSNRWGVGYKHMCYFWSINLFSYLSDYEYVIRIDEDVMIQKFNASVLDRILDLKIQFSVPHICDYLDVPDVMIGIEKLTEQFIRRRDISKEINFSKVFAPYTNFMIVNLDYYRTNNLVMEYLQEVNLSHGIYSNRWGDATIWAMIIHLLDDKPFYEINDVVYYHGSHEITVNEI